MDACCGSNALGCRQAERPRRSRAASLPAARISSRRRSRKARMSFGGVQRSGFEQAESGMNASLPATWLNVKSSDRFVDSEHATDVGKSLRLFFGQVDRFEARLIGVQHD